MLASKTFLAVPAIPLSYPFIIAMLLIAIGAIPFTSAAFLFIKARTTVNPTQPEASSSLITDGTYRFTRNPMYIGFLLWLMAWGVYLEDMIAISAGPLFFSLVH
jgi:protein-S-isoprenylcysteine O-methyltransferase Ste14